MAPVLAVISVSTLVQLGSAVLALRLVRVTGRRRAWVLIAVALALMAARRAMTLVDLANGRMQASPSALQVESLALVISVLMLAGIAMIGPEFRLAGADAGEARRLAARLAASERRLRTVLDAIPEAFVVLVGGRVVFASHALEDVLGHAPDVALGRDIEELGGSVLAEAVRAVPPGEGGGSSWDVALSGVETELNGRPVSLGVAVRVGSWDGQPARICLIADATERARARAALHRERSLFAAGPVLLLRWSAPPERRLVFVTENARDWGFDPDAGRTDVSDFHTLIHLEDLDRVREEARAALASGRASWSSEYRLVCPDGVERWVFDVTVVGRDESGAITHFDGYLLDISDRKRVEAALAASEERFRLAAWAVQEVIYDWDVASDRIEWWTSGDMAFGWPLSDLPGSGEERLGHIHPEDVGEVRLALAAALEGGDVFAAEYRTRHRGGDWSVVVDRARVVHDGSASRRVVGALLDVSERRRLQEQVSRSRRFEAVGSLAGGVAHEFNNLLTAIIGAADLLELTEPPDAGGRGELDVIQQASRRAARLTHALLAFAGRQVLRPVAVDLNQLIEAVLPVLRDLMSDCVEIDFIAGPRLATVKVDRGQAEQILANLCLNSRDAMRDGGTVTIATENVLLGNEYVASRPWAKPGDYVRLSVTDTGGGMSEAAVRRAFEPFYSTKKIGEGSGLGLATVYGIVKQHGGMIDIESAPGQGTVVNVYLPVVEGEALAGGVITS